jgi:hypothetical protein
LIAWYLEGKVKVLKNVFKSFLVVTSENYSQRISYAKTIVSEYYRYSPSDPFKIVVKEPITPDQALRLLFSLPFLDYDTDGLILVCETFPYLCGRDNNLLKYKQKEDHTVDFKIKVRICGFNLTILGCRTKWCF